MVETKFVLLKRWLGIQMENAKHRIVSFWLTHIFLRRIAKRYPEYFMRWIKDLTDDVMARKNNGITIYGR